MRQIRIIRMITNRDASSLDKYLLEIGKIKLLSSDEEVFLALQIKEGNLDAMEKLVTSNLRFVISVAKQYQNQGLLLADLINEGNMGLIKAALRFDLTKGFRFISYAVWWIRQAILQALADDARMVKLPQNKVDTISRINRTIQQLEQKYERDPTADEIAETLNLNVLLVDQSMQAGGFHLSLDAPLYDDEENENSQYDLYANECSPQPDHDLLRSSLMTDIIRSFSILDYREGEIISLYYGLNGMQIMSLEDISIRFNLTRERVRQIRDIGIKKLKNSQQQALLRPHMG